MSKVKVKLIVEFDIELDTEWYDNVSVDEMIEIETENAKNGDLIEILLSEQPFTVKLEKV